MARVRMVTRTINSTKAHVLCVNPTTREVEEKDILLAGTFNDEKAFAKALAKIETDTMKVVSVYSTEIVSDLYGMTEQKFLELSHKIDKHEASEVAEDGQD